MLSNKYSIESSETYILGLSLVIEALKHKPKELTKIYFSSDIIHNSEYDLLISLCKKNNIEYSENDKILNSLSSKENCYAIAIMNKYKTKLSFERHIILKDLNDEGELGTIIRSLASFDFKNLVLINSNVDIFNPKVIRSSMGGFFHINIAKYDTLKDYSDNFNSKIIAVSNDGDIELNELNYNNNYSILIEKDKKSNYYIKHKKGSDISLSSICSIVLNHIK